MVFALHNRISVTQIFCKLLFGYHFITFIKMSIAEMISQFAQNEQNMNAVERVLHYSDLPPEGDASTPGDPPMSWPEKGHISFIDVEMTYREGLPLVLKGITFQVHPGEKVRLNLFLWSS